MRNSGKRGREDGTPSVHRVITTGKGEVGRVVVVVNPPSASSGQALRRAQDRLSVDTGRHFEKLRAGGGGANPGVLKRVGRDTPMGGRAEEEVDRCPVFAADVSSFGVNVSSFHPNVSTFRANVSSLCPNVSSRD